MAHLAHYDEAHPLPFRITHWINLVAMVFLIISGCIIHFPFVPGVMGIARGAHIFFGFVLMINCLVRVIMAFVVKSAPTGGTHAVVKDYKTWLPQADNRHQLGAWIKYYLFMKKDHPQSAKLGVPQKISYLLIPVLILIMFVTGLCIWGPTMGATAGLTAALGGQWAVRSHHNCMMYVFIVFIFIIVIFVVIITTCIFTHLKSLLSLKYVKDNLKDKIYKSV